MPTLRFFPPSGSPQLFAVHKPITTLGRALGNDIHVPDASVLSHHAQVVFNGRDFEVEVLDRDAVLAINGKRKRRARLVNGDRLTLGEAQLAFSMFSDTVPADDRESVQPGAEIAGFRRLFEFSQRLMSSQGLDELLEILLDSVLELTGAARGMVLMVDGQADEQSRIQVRASRNVGEVLATDAQGISDSIVLDVIQSRRPVIVSDALTDTNFGKSASVIALKLSSVMCVPLFHRGEVMGALYVANDEIKSLFERAQLDLLTVFAGQASLLLTNAMLVTALRADKKKLEEELGGKRFGEIIGSCPSMQEVFRKLQKVATTDISVLITGETGTGKELIAREIHRRSERESGPFVTVNCGAIPENLMESEMFGHVKGAFTGAVASRGGKFQQANGGTLFLDEVGELTPQLQVKLLRALQERMITRVGDSRAEKVDIRVLSATNRNLEEMIQEGTFREDLYYRLNVVNLWLPPLRDRADDVFIIAKVLLSKYADELSSSVKGFSPNALTAIRRYAWPGNIRQLENRLKKALVLCDKNLLTPEDLDLGEDKVEPIIPLERAKEEFQRRYVLQALERNAGNRTQTARDLGVDPRTIFRYLEREQKPPGTQPP
jgi:transcriptional regulator with GAF, ATPase, and Fis domain